MKFKWNELVYKTLWTCSVLKLECLLRLSSFYTKMSILFSIEQWLALIVFIILNKTKFYLKHSIFDSNFYWFDSFYLWYLIGRFVKALNCLCNTLCAPVCESHLWQLVFENTWTEFSKHKNWFLPNFVNIKPRNLSDHKALEKKLAHHFLKFV